MEEQLREEIMALSEEMIKRLTAAMRERGQKPATLLWMEVTVVAVVAGLAVGLIKGLIGVLWGRGYEGSVIECEGCRGAMKFQRYANRRVISGFGRFKYERAYYYCGGCRQGRAPLDERLQVGRRQVSPRLQRVMGFLSGHLSFPVVGKAIKESLGVVVSDETIRQLAHDLGQQARQWEEQQRQAYEAATAAAATAAAESRTWVVEIDGKKIGYQDGSWKETKVGVIYELSHRVEIHRGRRELVKRELIARRCDWLEFRLHLGAALRRAGVRPGDQVVAIADGAKALEQIFDLAAPDAVQVRDFYHVAQRVWAIGELRYGAQTPRARAWIRLKLAHLKRSQVSRVIGSIAGMKFDTELDQQTQAEVLTYLRNQAWAMDYAHYLEQQWPIGSGAVEGGCRLIGWRMNGCGRRWSLPGGDALTALRVAVLNDRLDQLPTLSSLQWNLAA